MNTQAIKQILNNSNGRFLTVTFTKKNGDERTITGRTGVTKGLVGGTRTTDPKKYFLIHENNNGYRAVNYDTVSQIKIDGLVFDISRKAGV